MPMLRITPLTTTPSRGPGSCWREHWSALWCLCALADVAAHRVATAALAAILSCGALIDGAEISGRGALATSEPLMLMISAGANRQGHPGTATGCHCPIACQPPLRCGAGRDGLSLVSVALAAAHFLPPTPGTGTPVEGAAVRWYPLQVLPDHPACRRIGHAIGHLPARSLAAVPLIPWRLVRRPIDRAGVCGGTALSLLLGDLVRRGVSTSRPARAGKELERVELPRSSRGAGPDRPRPRPSCGCAQISPEVRRPADLGDGCISTRQPGDHQSPTA